MSPSMPHSKRPTASPFWQGWATPRYRAVLLPTRPPPPGSLRLLSLRLYNLGCGCLWLLLHPWQWLTTLSHRVCRFVTGRALYNQTSLRGLADRELLALAATPTLCPADRIDALKGGRGPAQPATGLEPEDSLQDILFPLHIVEPRLGKQKKKKKANPTGKSEEAVSVHSLSCVPHCQLERTPHPPMAGCVPVSHRGRWQWRLWSSLRACQS